MTSSGGKLSELVKYGAIDHYLTNKPKPNITFFKCVYKRNDNFIIETETNSKSKNEIIIILN